MKGYKTCIIAFLDILGFKQLINKKQFDTIRKIFSSILSDEDAIIALHIASDRNEMFDSYNKILDTK